MFVNSMRSIGGGERWLLEVADGLAVRGHDVAFAVRAGGDLGASVRERGLPLLNVPMRGDLDAASILATSRWIRSFGAGLISVNVQRAVRIGGAAAALAGVRPVVERRGLLFRLKPSARNRFVYSRLVSRVVANCGAIKDDIVASGLVGPDRVTVIRNGIDAARVRTGGGVRLREELSLGDAPVVAVVGRLAPDKGHEVAFRAFADVVSRLPRARLVLAGGGKLMGDLRALAAATLPAGSVTFLGHVDNVGRVLDAADVVLVTSHREGMPHVVLEAMAAGTPVVATSVAGIPEMIEDGKEGLLVPDGAHDRAAGAVASILSDPDAASRLVEAARRRVESEFSLEEMIDEVERCFVREAETPPGRAAAGGGGEDAVR